MKKVSLMLVLLAVFASLIVFAKNRENTQDPNSNSVSKNSIVKPNSTTSKIESESKDTESNSNEIVESIVDYNGTSLEDWGYSKDNMPEPFDKISDMNNIEYGTAGSSFQKACATVDMLVLSNKEETVIYVEEFMKSMTPIQKDYFSMNWEVIMAEANEAFDDSGEDLKRIITGFSEPEGAYDLDMSLYSKEKLSELDKKVNDIFLKHNVTKEWKNHPEMMFG